jgi:hypothetical protein
MSFSNMVEDLLRPLRPELYVGCRYRFWCRYGNEHFKVTGIITNLVTTQKQRWQFSVSAQGFTGSEVLALIRESDGRWLLNFQAGANFTQLIEGKFELE